jgi:predicted PurR-regulated permease PerM
MKDFYLYLCFAIVIIAMLIYFVSEQNLTNRFINELQNKERENIKKIERKLDSLKTESVKIDNVIDSLKNYIDKKDIQLNTNIQRINNKKDAQIRNVSDSSSIALLKLLQPK